MKVAILNVGGALSSYIEVSGKKVVIDLGSGNDFSPVNDFLVPLFMGRITKRFFNGDGQNGESCLFIGSYRRRTERGK